MKIAQIGSQQFVFDDDGNTVRKTVVERLSPMHSETANVIKTAREIETIRRETDYIKDTGDIPPTWRMNYMPRLNVI